MADCDDRQLTEAQRVAGYQNGRTGVAQAVRPFSGRPTVENLIDYINRELYPAVRRTRDKVNDIYLPVADNAPSGNPLGFYFSTETGAADPTAGRIRLNASPQDTATIMRVSQSNGRLVDVAPWLDVMAGGATTPLGVVTLTDAINPARFIRFDLSTMTDQGAYWDLAVAVIESSHDDPFVDGGAVVVSFIPGVGGVTAATVPPGAITPIAADTVVGNITTSTAAPAAVPLANLDSTSIIYDATSHTFQRAALTSEVTATQNSNTTTITRSTDFTWTGKHQWNSWMVLGTQQNETAFTAGALNVTLLDTVTRLYILISGDGEIQTVTPAGGTTTTGRVVFVLIVGSGIKTVKHASGSGNQRILCPNNRDHKFTNRQSFWLVGDGTNGWMVSLSPPEAMSGLSVMATATTTAGYPAAVTASGGGKYFGTNAAGTALTFQTLSTTFPGAPIYDVRDYGAVGDGVADDGPAINLAISAANATPGVIYLMPNHRIATALDQITETAVIVKGRSEGFEVGTQIYIDIAGTSATGFHFNGGQYSGILDCYFRAGRIYTSECYAVVLEEGFGQFAHHIRVDHHWGGIHVLSSSETRLSHIWTRYLVGSTGVKFSGSSGNNAYRLVFDTALLDQPPAVAYPGGAAGNDTPWAPSTAYTLGQFKESNGYLYQCTTAGTSASGGSGPSGLPPTATTPGQVFTHRITDGTVEWAYLCPLDFSHILNDSFAYTLVLDHIATLNGVYPLRIIDTAATGLSRPAFTFANLLETDHNWRGILLERGQEATFQGCSLGACLSESAVKVESTYGFDWTFIGCKNFGNAKHGFDIAASYGHIIGCKIGNNGQLASNTYDGISIASSCTDFEISGNESVNTGSSQRYGLSIGSSCDDYNVVGNNFSGNATGAILNTPGYATTRVVAWNTPFAGLVDAMVATGAAITTDKLGALTGEVTKPSGSTATTVVRSTNFTWTGNHSFGAHFILGTQQNYTGSLGVDISLNNTTNRLYILVTGTGDIETITPASGTTDVGRCVLVYIVGTGTKTVKHNFSGGGVGRLLCPNNVDLVLGNRDSFLLVGDGSNGWCVTLPYAASAGLSDGDKGDITVSSSGATWTIDNGVVSLAKQADMAQSRIQGRAEGAGTGVPTALTPTQVVAIIDGENATWTGAHSFTGASHTINVTGAVAIDADATSNLTTSVGNMTVSTTAAAGLVTVQSRGGPTSSGAEVRLGQDVNIEGSNVVRISTGSTPTERLEIEADGAWQLDGDTGDLGSALLSQGSSTTPIWSDRSDVVTRTTIISGGSSAESDIVSHVVAAGSWVVGTTYEFYAHCEYVRSGAAATSHTVTIDAELNGTGIGVQVGVVSGVQNSVTATVLVRGTFTCSATGGSGTGRPAMAIDENILAGSAAAMSRWAGTNSPSLDTTASNTLSITVDFSAGIAGVSFVCQRAWIRRVV